MPRPWIATAVLGLWAVAVCGGCQSGTVFSQAAAEPEPAPRSDKRLREDAWNADPTWTVWQRARNGPARHFRWRFPDEEELREGLPEAADLAEGPYTLATANQMILLARWQPERAAGGIWILEQALLGVDWAPTDEPDPIPERGVLKKTKPEKLRGPSLRTRAAAAEAWCAVVCCADADAARSQPATEQDELGEILEWIAGEELPPEVQGELFRGLAAAARPREIPGLVATLEQRESGRVLRRAAVEACTMYALAHPQARADTEARENSPWPAVVWSLQTDPDAGVRQAFGELLAAAQHPEALGILEQQLQDQEPGVQQAALASLGRLKSPEARAILEKQAQRPEELVRQGAVRGLAGWGEAALVPLAGDASPTVRRQVAQELTRFHSLEAARTLEQFLSDANVQVQSAVVEGLPSWPDRLAKPLLVTALVTSATVPRQTALRALEERSGETIVFPLTGTRREREEAVAALAKRWQIASPAGQRLASSSVPANTPLDPTRLEEIREQLDRLARGLQPGDAPPAWTPADLPFLEHLLPTLAPAQQTLLFDVVLPPLGARYQALRDLASRDVQLRRRAAQTLAQEARRADLAAWVVRRIQGQMTFEQDRLVWRYVLEAIRQDDRAEAADVALLAINHHWPDIRALGCEYVEQHGRHAYAAWLLPLFQDGSPVVRLAAARAAGRCGNPIVVDGIAGDAGRQGLRPWLASPQLDVRLEAAACMSRFGDVQAMQELARLSLADDPDLRGQVVMRMGESGQTRFVEHLIRAAWTERQAAVRLAAIESLKQLVPPQDQPQGLATVQSVDAAVELWADWWNGGRGSGAGGRSKLAGNGE